MGAKYSLFYDILSNDSNSEPSTNSIYDKVLLLKYTLSQAIEELEQLLKAKEDGIFKLFLIIIIAKNHVKALISEISSMKQECTNGSILHMHLKVFALPFYHFTFRIVLRKNALI